MRIKKTWFSKEIEFTPDEIDQLYGRTPTNIRNKILAILELSPEEAEEDINEKN